MKRLTPTRERPEKPKPHALRGVRDGSVKVAHRALGLALEALSICVAATGAALALYAVLWLPTNDHSGLEAVEGWAQFAFAVGVPLAACIAAVASDRLRKGQAGPRLPVAALIVAGLSAAGWVLVFFDWSA